MPTHDNTSSAPAEWKSIPEAAEHFSMSADTIRRMISRGELEARRFGPRLIRVRIADIVAASRPLNVLDGGDMDDAFATISFRDALERAANLKSAGDAQRLLELAIGAGDQELADAVERRARSAGWSVR